jgi:PAS domain S-box-containing protein
LTVPNRPWRREGAPPDIVGDRHRLLLIGMAAVGGACVIFAASRLAITASSGLLTPWWIDAAGAVAMAGIYLWYRAHPARRSGFAVHATAAVATGVLLVPIGYGMASTIWWLSLVAFGVVLLGRRREAWIWGVSIPVLVTAAALVERRVQIPGAAGEPETERVLARVVFVVVVVAVAGGFRKVANQRAAALHESEERFRVMADGTPALIWVAGPDRLCTYFNKAWLGFTGRTLAEEVGNGWAEGVHPDDRGRCLKVFEEAFGERRPFSVEYRLRRSDGEYRWVVDHGMPRFTADGSFAGFIGAAFDVNDRRTVENQLRDSEDRFRRLSDAAFEGIAITDRGTLVDGNRCLAEMLRCAPEGLIGRSALDFIAPEARDVVADHFRTGAEDTYEHTMVRADGSTFLAEVQGRSLPYGARTLRVTAIRDVSERRHTEETLRTQTAALESAADAIAITDSGGTIIWANQAFSALSGYSTAELVGENPRLLKSGVQDEAFYHSLWGTITDGRVWHGELVNRRKDGSLWQEEMTITPVPDEAGRIAHFIAIKRNVTEHRQLEEQLRHSQKMEAVGRLAGGVAHDFNNVLQAMVAQLALLRSSHSDASAMRSTIDELDQQVRRGASLTRQLLLFSRRETTRFERFDINDVIRDAAGMLRRLVRENIRLVVDPSPDELPAEADRAQLEQVLMNLAVNASDAMPTGGILTIRTGGREASVWFTVEDTGHGIPEAIRDRIFEPFFTTKGPSQGTGLGLSVVHGIVTKHGGTILFDSEAGRGTLFRVTLPRADMSRSDAATRMVGDTGGQAHAGRGERVLVVEDEPGAREGLAQVLTMLGYEATAVGTAREAAGLPAAPPFDLLLSDLLLPDAAGIDLVTFLRQRWPSARVILMSGYSENGAVREGVAAGLVRFLQKPFDMATLATEVRGALDESSA